MRTTVANGNWKEQKSKLKKEIAIMVIMISFFVLIFTIESFSQNGMNGKGNGGWGMGTQYGKMYDPKTIETIAGVVVGVEKFTPSKGMSSGVHLMVKTDKETISVHLGPAWYIEKQSITIKLKDKIEVKGSRINFDGKPAIIAAEVKKDNGVLILRDANGIPVWSGSKQH